MKKSIKRYKMYFYELITSFVSPIIAFLLFSSIFKNLFITCTLLCGTILLIIRFLKPKILLLLYKYFLIFLRGIKSFLIFIFIIMTYCILVQPISFLMKLFGYDPLDRKITSLESYRKNTKNKNIDLTKIF